MPARPNVLLITADHLRYDTLGCHGDPVIQTPNIDALAQRATDFSRYFVQNPVCQPSRASLLTGRYPRHHGVRHNGNRLDENEMTLVEFFHRAGYTTAVIGKHHVGQSRFQSAIDHGAAHHCRRNWSEREDGNYVVSQRNEFEDYVHQRGYEYRTGYALPEFRERLGAVPSDLPEDCHIDAYVGMKTVEYLEQVDADNPFFLWLGFYGPHHPYVPSGRFGRMYQAEDMPPFHRAEDDFAHKPVEYRLYRQCQVHKYRGFTSASEQTFREMKAAYYGMVSQLDWKLGDVLACLERRGLSENTIIVLTSDHGEFLGDHGLPAKAPFLLDCMLHVPCLIAVPGGSGHAVDDLAEEVDLFPTLAELAGLEVPEWVQGRSQAQPVTGCTATNPRESVYAEMVDKKCIRTERWKYIHYPGKPRGELYDLADDPHELHNLYQDRPDLVAELRAQFYAKLDETEDVAHPKYMRFSGRDPETGEDIHHYLTW
jgi:arylsulfatase A-like enzyme